jgi:hypothetical protein
VDSALNGSGKSPVTAIIGVHGTPIVKIPRKRPIFSKSPLPPAEGVSKVEDFPDAALALRLGRFFAGRTTTADITLLGTPNPRFAIWTGSFCFDNRLTNINPKRKRGIPSLTLRVGTNDTRQTGATT